MPRTWRHVTTRMITKVILFLAVGLATAGFPATVGLTLILGAVLIMTYPPLAAIGWTRVHLHDHTTPQVLATVPIGALSVGLTFALVR
jgi:FtsH-binding integral membrane protein